MTIDKSFFTKAVHAGAHPEKVTGAVMPPIFMSSTFAQESPGEHKGFDYSRAGNPSRNGYEEALAALEGAEHGLAFASGLAAEQAIAQLLNPGARVLVCDDVYGGTGRLFRRLYAKYNLNFVFIDMTSKDEIKAAAAAGPVDMIWVETPTNPTMKIINIRAMAAIAKEKKAILVVDNTFATPLFQSPLKLGADIVVHSTTKYIGGHSDVIGGAVMVSDDNLHEQLRFIQFAAGAVPSPFECFLLHRSVKTLAIRMTQHEINATAVSTFLSDHKKVRKTYYPGLKSDAGHSLAREQMSGFSGMVSFDHTGNYDEVVTFIKKLKVFTLAESLGGVESLINHPEKMTHASVPEDLRKKLGIGPSLLRLSCGIESADDLIADLKQALG